MSLNKINSLNKKIFTSCLVAACFTLPIQTFAGEEFSPLTIASSNSIYLDSSQVEHPMLKDIFPSPSEYKSKNKLPVDIFTPVNAPKVYEQTYKVETNTAQPEIRPVDTTFEPPQEESAFSEFNHVPSPSDYLKPTQKNIVKTSSKEETPDIETSRSEEETYYASAQSGQDENGEIDLDGKVIQSITFSGLEHINENTVLNEMTSRNGSIFNAQRLQNDLQKIYSLGYFTDSMLIEPSLNEDDTVSLQVILKENPLVKEVKIKGNTVFSENEILAYTKNLIGMPQNLYFINASIEKINKLYEDKGYILAKVSSVDDSDDGTLTLEISEGIIDKITFEGVQKTQDYVIKRNVMTQPGTVYNEELLKKDLSKIYATQIFDEVNRKIEPSPDKDGEYIVKIVIKEASTNSVTIGGGIDNALGVFGQIGIHERNFLGRAQQVSLTGMLGSGLLLSDQSIKNRMNYQIELSFLEPHFINADNSLQSKLYIRELGSYQIPLAVERRFGINGIIKHKVRGNDRLTTNLGIGYENIHLKEGDYGRISEQYRLSNLDIRNRAKQLTGGHFINIAPGVQYSTLDSEFMPRSGVVAQASFIESIAVNHLKNTSGRLVGKITKYIPVFKKSTLLIGTKGGIKVHGNEMPEVMAFNLGGPYTIRGFRMSGVGSGTSFLMGSAELQTPIPFMDRFKYDVLKNLRFAFFIDAGKVWDPTITSKLYDRPNSAITMGVGLRINIPGLGPITVDYGLPLTHVGRYNKQHGYFTFGTGGLYDSY